MNRIERHQSPAELRQIFGANLRQLSKRAASISALCRELGINRTQYNRYLSGESFPRPDVLHKICTFFEVDARILVEPVDDILAEANNAFQHPEIRDYIGGSLSDVTQELLPDGFFRFSRQSFFEPDKFVIGLTYVYRKDGLAFIKGYEAREAMRQQGLPVNRETREFRGLVMRQESGVVATASRLNALTFSVTYLSSIPSFENNYWVGFTVRPVRENPPAQRIVRVVFEHLGRDSARVLAAARNAGLCSVDDLLPYHRTQLRPGAAFN